MHSSVIAVVLCFAAHAAVAQCVDPAPVAQHTRHGADLIKKTEAAAPAPRAAHAGGALIKTAVAGTHDKAPSATRSAPAAAPGDEEHRQGGPAMLLAALALMSGIALRRLRQ